MGLKYRKKIGNLKKQEKIGKIGTLDSLYIINSSVKELIALKTLNLQWDIALKPKLLEDRRTDKDHFYNPPSASRRGINKIKLFTLYI